MRIAFVTDSYWPRVNGVSVSVQTFTEELVRRGHECVILCPEYPDAGQDGSDDECVIRFPSVVSAVSAEDRLVRLDAFPLVFRALDRFRPDLLYVQTEFAMQIAGRMYARSRGLPLVCCAHTDWEEYIAYYLTHTRPDALKALVRFLMRRIFGTADVVVTPSKSMERILCGYGIKKPFHVIPTGIPSMFSPRERSEVEGRRAALDAKFPVLAGKRLLLFAGRVTEEKDVDFLVPVLERVLRSRPDVALLVAGDGPHRASLEALVASRNLRGSVAFAGYMPRTELPLVYASSDVFVFPSKTETLGLCTIESMATGLPVVAVGEMGTRDVMEGDNGGFMVKDDVEEFAAAVLRLLGDEELRRAKAAEAVAWSRHYSIETTTDSLLALFAKVVRGGRRRAAKIRALRRGLSWVK